MLRKVIQGFPFVLVVMVAAVSCAAPNVLGVLEAIQVNQIALLQEINASSTTCASRDSELREIRLLKLEAMKHLQGMKDEVKTELQSLRDEVMERLETKEREITEVLQTLQSTSSAQPSQQPPALPDLDALHNDSNPSLCGPLKVLYGSRGSLSPSHPRKYLDNVRCEWRVVLPVGTRPVFTWEYLLMEACTDCGCDSVTISAPGAEEWPALCGSTIPTSHPMDNITGNEFTVVFTSDGSRTGRGFMLYYGAELL